MYVSLPSTSLYRKTLLGTQLYIKHYKMKQNSLLLTKTRQYIVLVIVLRG